MRSVNGEIHENGKRVADILQEMKAEIVAFADTRLTILRTELQEKWNIVKMAIPLAGAAVVLLTTAFLLLTGALVGLVLAAFPNSIYRWFFACLIVGLSWAILGAGAAYFAKREFDARSMVPKRTLEVLKGDKVWIQAEVRNRI